MWINIPGLLLLVTICSLAGMVVYAEFRRCDPLATDRIHAIDQVSGSHNTCVIMIVLIVSGRDLAGGSHEAQLKLGLTKTMINNARERSLIPRLTRTAYLYIGCLALYIA